MCAEKGPRGSLHHTAKTWHGPKPTFRVLRRKPDLPTNLRVRSVFNVMVSKFSHKDRDNLDRGRLKLVGKSSYDRDVLEKWTGNVTWRCEPKRVVLMGGQSSQSPVLFMGRAVLMRGHPSQIPSSEQAKARGREFQDYVQICSGGATRASPSLVGENVTARNRDT
ncbi:hypothetical protein GQ457_13G027570 [Hibiscus cannabinus]